MRSLTLEDHGSAVELDAGEAMRLCLPENATSGYRWTAQDFDPAVISVDEDVPAAGVAIGSGGEARFRLRALGPGETALSLVYRRQWEGRDSTLKRFELRVKVREGPV